MSEQVQTSRRPFDIGSNTALLTASAAVSTAIIFSFDIDPRSSVGLLVLLLSVLLLLINKESVIYAVLTAVVVLVDGWLPTRSPDDVPFRLGIGRLYLLEIPIYLLLLSLLVTHWLNRELLRKGVRVFSKTALDSPLRFWLLLLPCFAVYGLLRGNPAQDAFGYYEWRCLFLGIVFYYLVIALFKTEIALTRLWWWFFAIDTAKACYSLFLYLTGISAPLPLVFGQGPIGEGPENVMHLFAGLSALSILLFGTVKEEGKRALLILGSCVVVANILVSQKRDPQVGLLIGIAVIAWRLPSKQKLQWALRAAGVLLLILAIGAFRQPASSGAGFADSISRYYEVVNFIEAPSIQVDPGDTILFHLFDIADGWERVKQKPLLGFGFGGQTERNLTQLSEAGGEYVGTGIIHNQYLTFWLKMGIAGPILFLWLLISFLIFCGKAVKNTPLSTPVALGIGIYASLWADIAMEFWAAGWVGNTKTPIIIFLSFALAVGLLGRNVPEFPNRVNGRHA